MSAALLLCLVVGITDGDTLTARCGDDPQIKVRLAEIDAPEKRQPYGQRSKEALSALAYGRRVELVGNKTDRNGRLIAHVKIDGSDVNFAMVEMGLAWCYEQYLIDRTRCHAAQRSAQSGKQGLWHEPDPTPPWEFRKQRRRPRAK